MFRHVSVDDYRALADAVTIASGYTAILRYSMQDPTTTRDFLLEYADGIAEQLALVDRWIPVSPQPNGPL